jgi:plasmid stabilization system protein ParE
MMPKVLDAIQRLTDAKWFRSVDEPIRDGKVIQVHSWKEASRYYSSNDWEDVANEAGNDLHAIGDTLHPDWSASRWNRRVKEIKRQVEPMVEERVVPIIRDQKISELLEACVKWDLVAFCEASEFRDEAPESFYLNIGEWYLSGHLPCGWVGAYPEGKLVVF